MERVRRTGIITDAEDRHMTSEAQSIIDDLLFKLEQVENEKHRLSNKVHDLMKRQRTHYREDDEAEGSRPAKRRDPYSTSYPPSRTSTPSSTGLSLDFDHLTTVGGGSRGFEPHRPQTDSPFATLHSGTPFIASNREQSLFRDNDYSRAPRNPPPKAMDSIHVTPPGPLDPDPIIRSDPRGISTVPQLLPEDSDDDDDSSDDPDPLDMTAKQKAKHNNKALQRERDQREVMMHRLDLPLASFWDVIKRTGYYERDNNMRNMLSGDFYVSGNDNTVYHRLHQSAQIALDVKGQPFEGNSSTRAFDKASPRGMPLTAWEVDRLIKILYNDYSLHDDRVLAYIFLREFYIISRGIVPDLRDSAMTQITTPGVFDPNYMPSHVSAASLLPRMPDPGKPVGLTNIGPEQALCIDEMARYTIIYGRPGTNPYTGVVMDYAYRVNRRSMFGYGLMRVLSPEGKATPFRRFVATLLALPRRYRDAIAEYNSKNLTNLFVPQPGPRFEITRLQIPPANIYNLNLQDIIDLFIANRIPPEWVDHGYTFGLNYIDSQYSTSQHVRYYEEVDNERLERLRVYGAPPAIPGWDGWRCPTSDDMRRIQQLIANKNAVEAPGFELRDKPEWVRVGEDGIFQYLTHRSEGTALNYSTLHPVVLPTYPSSENNASSSGADTHMSAPDPGDTNVSTGAHEPMEVEATANAEAPPPEESAQGPTHQEGDKPPITD
jgi:hypothetical protein